MWELEELGRDFISHVSEKIKAGIQAFKCDTTNLRSKKKIEIDQPEWSWNPPMAASKYTTITLSTGQKRNVVFFGVDKNLCCSLFYIYIIYYIHIIYLYINIDIYSTLLCR